MTTLQKRLALLFAGLPPTLGLFWVLLWTWDTYNPLIHSDYYQFGWVVSTAILIGIPMLIFGITTVVCVVDDRDYKIDQHYENLTKGMRRGRAMLSRRLAPPEVEEEKA